MTPLAEHLKGGYEGRLIALPSEYWPSARDNSPQARAHRLLLSPQQVVTSKGGPKTIKPRGYVDGATARAHLSTARVLAKHRAIRP